MEGKSLVGYGVSSDSEENEGESSTQTEKEKETKAEGRQKTLNFLLESMSASSSESEQEEYQEEPAEAVRPGVIDPSPKSLLPLPMSSLSRKLPPPPLEGGSSCGLPAGSSVFANPFKERAEERLNVLQKHVPLTLQARPTQIGGKRICVAYRKDGHCRFGIRCKFAHDSDLQSSTGFPTEQDSFENGAVDKTEFSLDSLHTSDCRNSTLERGKEEEEDNW
ncbi:hypothetical protein NFI96_002461 [Prochilodus magdalenae]|nr:hypothetical protein NFI96_002461 [Prochilodus magdalenae]